MAEITKELGRIPVSRGNYQATTEYYKDNIVQYKRGSYQVVSESPIVGVPPTNDNNVVNPEWTLFAGILDAQDVVNQIKDQEIKSIQAVAAREAEILAKSDAAEVSFDNTGTSISETNVQDALKKTDGKLSKLESEVIYDVTANNDGVTFSSLSALLSSENLSTLIPTSVRHGGMSIRFVQSSDNKYVQYRLMNQNWSTVVTDWQGVDDEPTANSKNLVQSGGVGKEIRKTKDTINDVRLKTNNISLIEQGGLNITDNNGNIVMKVDENGLDAAKVAHYLIELIHSNNPMMKSVKEDGINITDNNGNIVMNLRPYIIDEDGFNLIDEEGNIIMVFKNGVIDASGLGENLTGIIETIAKNNTISIENLIQDYRKSYVELKKLKDETSAATMSLRKIKKSGVGVSKTITIPSRNYDRDSVVVRIGLHYGNLIGGTTGSSTNPEPWNDVYFNSQCEKDFSDVRVLDNNGNILDCKSGEGGNFEVVRDTNIPNNHRILKDSQNKIYTIIDNYLKSSSDCGATWDTIFEAINYGTAVYIDSRDILYLNKRNKLYMVPAVNGEYLEENVVEILDSDVMNPDGNADTEQLTSVCEDNDGYIYVGRYQLAYNPIVYRSVNNDLTPSSGAYFKIVYNQTNVAIDERDQHVHHIDVCKTTGTVYIGLDNAKSPYGARVIKSDDNGDTWSNVTIDSDLWNYQRGRDYLPVWFSSDGSFMLGGGEVGILGGYTICKVKNGIANGIITEESIKGVLDTAQGIRKISSFDDNFIVAGLCARGSLTSKQMLMLSTDKGESWKCIYSEDNFDGNGFIYDAGSGARWFVDPFVPMGETEPCMIITGKSSSVNQLPLSSLRVFRGGNHYYKEIYVNVGSIPANTTKTLNVESGYIMASPDLEIYNRNKPVWTLPLNEGNGNIVVDSDGVSHKIYGNFEWDKQETSVRFDSFYPYHKDYNETSGIALGKGAYIDLGKINKLSFKKNFTLFFWFRYDTLQGFNFRPEYNASFPIINGGSNGLSISLFRAGVKVGSDNVFTRGTDVTSLTYPCYVPLAITVGDESIPIIYAGRGFETYKEQNVVVANSWNFKNLSEYSLKIGTDTDSNSKTNYADVYLNSIAFYDRALTRRELISLFYGYDA